MGSKHVLLLGGRLGPAEWEPVEDRLLETTSLRVTNADVDLSHLSDSACISNAYWRGPCQAFLNEDMGPVDLVVGLGDGAGPAAKLAAMEGAARAVLLAPSAAPLARTHLGVVALLPDFNAALGDMSERLKPYQDELSSGTLRPEAIDILYGAYTGESHRVRMASIAKEVLPAWMPINKSIRPTDDDLDAADWTSSAQSNARIGIWYTSEYQALAEFVEREIKAEVTLTDWPIGSWLTAPEAVADMLRATLADSG